LRARRGEAPRAQQRREQMLRQLPRTYGAEVSSSSEAVRYRCVCAQKARAMPACAGVRSRQCAASYTQSGARVRSARQAVICAVHAARRICYARCHARVKERRERGLTWQLYGERAYSAQRGVWWRVRGAESALSRCGGAGHATRLRVSARCLPAVCPRARSCPHSLPPCFSRRVAAYAHAVLRQICPFACAARLEVFSFPLLCKERPLGGGNREGVSGIPSLQAPSFL